MDSLTPEVASVFRTVITGDMEQINQAINNYRDPKGSYHRYFLYQKKDSDGGNLLHYACMYNTDEVATWMLSLKDDHLGSPIPKISDKFGATAVVYAVSTGKISFLKQWIKEGGQIQFADRQGMNILDYCLGAGEIFPKLSGASWDPTYGNMDQIIQVAKSLIEKGLQCSALQKRGITPVEFIDKYWGSINFEVCIPIKVLRDIYECMIKGTKPKEVYGGQTHLCVAICFMQNYDKDNNQRMAQFENMVTRCKLNINETDSSGMTALHHLCYYEYDSEPYGLREVLVAKLLELGADPNVKDIRGYTPLMCAIEKGYTIKYDPFDPRSENDKGIGQLLKVNVEPQLERDLETKKVDMQMAFIMKIEHMTHKIKAQEASFKDEIATIMAKHNDTKASISKEITSLKSTKEGLEMVIMSLQTSNDSLESKYIILQESLRQQKEDSDELKSVIGALQASNAELHQQLEQSFQEIAKLKSSDEDLNNVNSKLTQKLEDQTNINDDLKYEIVVLQGLQNTHNEMQHKIEEQVKEINELKLKVKSLEKEMKEDTTTSSLLLSNVTLTDVCRHLKAGVEVTCLPGASLEDLQFTISKDDQKYKNIYLVTGHSWPGNDVQALIAQYRTVLVVTRKKSKKVIVSSILPALEQEAVNAQIELANKSLSVLCQETGCEFIDNDSTFKYKDGTIVEDCFDEEGTNLSEFGIKRLLKNLRLFTAKKRQLATNI